MAVHPHVKSRLILTLMALALVVSVSPYSLVRTDASSQSPEIESRQASNQPLSQIPPAVIAQRDLGIRKYREHDFVSASKLLKESLKKNPADYVGWQYLGLSLLSQRKFKDASKAFETALKLHPDFAEAHVGLAYSFLNRNKLSAAKQEAEAAIRLNDKLADAYYVLGGVQLRSNLRNEAVDSAETAIRLDPNSAPAYLLKSVALVDFFFDGGPTAINGTPTGKTRGRLKEAADALEKYLQLNPNDPDKEDWLYQLSSLRFHSSARRPGQRPAAFTGTEVTTKARLLEKPEPGYTDEARQNGIQGKVVLRAIFAADGTVKHLIVVSALPHGLTRAAIRAAQRIKFVPATINGEPVSTFIQLEYNFNLY